MLGLGCGEPLPVAPPPPGFSAGTAAELEVFALDEVTRTPIVGADVLFEGSDGLLGTVRTDADGRAVLATTEAATAIEVRAGEHVAERWTGIGGRSLAIPLERHTTLMHVEETLSGAEGEWTVVATSPARVLHVAPLVASISAPCVADASGCAFAMDAPVDETTSFFAFHSTGGVPDELRVLGTLSGGADLTAAMRFGVTEVDVTLPDPGLGAEAVVGVPGLAVSGRVAVLPWPMSASAIALPDTSAALGSAWALFSTTLAEGSRSVLVQRDAEPDATLAAWTGWLTAPEMTVSAGTATVTYAEADVVAIAWYAGTTLVRNDVEVRRSGATLAAPLTIPEGATRALLRAVDTTLDTDATRFDLDRAERQVTRLAEREITLP